MKEGGGGDGSCEPSRRVRALLQTGKCLTMVKIKSLALYSFSLILSHSGVGKLNEAWLKKKNYIKGLFTKILASVCLQLKKKIVYLK